MSGRLSRAAAATLLLALACAPVRVSVDFDPEEDFSRLETFTWIPIPQERTGDYRIDSPFLEKRIRDAVERVLASKGYRKVEDRDPDFFVGFHLSIEDRIDVVSINRYYRDHYWQYSVPETRVNQFEEGTLVIDIADAREKELVWRGVGQGTVPRRSTPEQTRRDVDAAVAEILKSFPPGRES